jgi:Fic family protein
MIADCRRIQDLVVTMQQAFLDSPALCLTLPQAQRRFGVSARTCEAVLGALAEAGVLERTREGDYIRACPRSDRRAA